MAAAVMLQATGSTGLWSMTITAAVAVAAGLTWRKPLLAFWDEQLPKAAGHPTSLMGCPLLLICWVVRILQA